ncbi:hypothetical protein RCL1_003940 [Eukaryota sp. TZLM3-RCL]
MKEDHCPYFDVVEEGVTACRFNNNSRSWHSLNASTSEKQVVEVKTRSKSLTQLLELRAPDSLGGNDRMAPHSRFRNLVKEAQVRKSKLTKFIDVLKEDLAVSVNRIKQCDAYSSPIL